jgi:hypothetical protein
MRAQRCIRKEVGLENTLPERWGLEGAPKREKIGLESALSKWRGLKCTLKKEVGPKDALFERWELKGTLKRDLLVRH